MASNKAINKTKVRRYNTINSLANMPVANDAVGMDMFRNAAARMGYGTPSLTEATEYELMRWTNDYWLMITLYRNHWLSRRIVEKPAQHMVQAWPKLSLEMAPNEISKFDRTIRRTFTPARIQKAITWARLFGGAGALIVIDGHEDILEEPLDLDTVAPGSYKGLISFDRWSGITPYGNEVTDIDKPDDFGFPEYYTINDNGGDQFRVHHSRVLRFSGPEVPTPEHQAAMYWGISELEIVYEEMRKRDNMSWSILQLLFRAQILTQKNPDLAQLMTGSFGGGKAAELYYRTMEAQNQLLSNNSMLILGEDSELQSHQYTFGGVSEIYELFRQDVVGASGIPEVILFGIQSKGFGESQEGDVRNYEMDIALKQNTGLRPQLDKLYPVICMSEFGEVPEDLDFAFPSIRILTEEEKTNLQKNGGQTIIDVYAAGLRSQKKSLMELKKLGELTGIGTTIDLKEIEDADDEVNVPLEIESAEARAGTEEFSESGGGAPRDENGKLASSNAKRIAKPTSNKE
jgi:phage-related protein (TIGR01555 family)